MKKLFLTLILSVLMAGAAHAQFYYGLQFGIYSDTSSMTDNASGAVTPGGSSFNYTIKPSIGYYFTPRLAAGLKFAYTNCAKNRSESGQLAGDINGMVMNLLMGNGLTSDYQSWSLSPYVRYKLLSIISDKLNIWAELDGYYGIRTPRDATTGKLDEIKRKTIYGVELHPLVSYDIADNFMLYTSLDFLSFSWDGSANRRANYEDTVQTSKQNVFVFQANPLVAIAKSFLNIGLIRRF